ncbi:MAG: SAM-dependent methyltransferase [Candidatus Scalindua sp.]|nr:SAM-dependent methyltransferase [Planctomycetota bacterium]GJQ59388.1 MAG: SAM-dependent methyltransferase [Candidatus Scalindua sp.]
MDAKSALINDVIKEGSKTFADFMGWALYHPEHGYYTSQREKIGREGDYYTSSDVHPVFGQLIGRQLEEMWRILGKGEFTVVEMGAGKGWLCYDVLTYIKGHFPEFFETIEYKIVEISRYHIGKQSEILKEFEAKVSWESSPVDRLFVAPLVGCVLSNEFVDSLPVHQVVVKDGSLREVYVTVKDGELCEVFDGPSTPLLEEYFEELSIQLKEGQRAEVNLKSLEWMKRVALNVKRGFVVTIDYGYLASDLYSDERFGGTLICYHRHTTEEDPFARVGNQDITSHVNFTGLMNVGVRSGLYTTGFTKQSHFLLALGILDTMKESHGDMGRFLTMKNLILPGGMGDVFKVLIQHKGLKDPKLIGLREMSEEGLMQEIESFENRR